MGGSSAVPVRDYPRAPGVPDVRVTRMAAPGAALVHGPHAHAFLVLAHVTRAGGTLAVAGRTWSIEAGDLYVIAPGEVVEPGHGAAPGSGWTVFFPPEAVHARHAGALASWRANPLLAPFARGLGTGARRLHVPPAGEASWIARLEALERELAERQEGYADAALALLTLLLVDTARLATDVVGDLRLRDEPVLAAVFAFIEAHYAEPVSLRDVARAVALTPGHLTTVVRRRTGRPVQRWITERRMAEARRLLAETDLTVGAVGARVGYRDAGWFVRAFRHAHGVTPGAWRAVAAS